MERANTRNRGEQAVLISLEPKGPFLLAVRVTSASVVAVIVDKFQICTVVLGNNYLVLVLLKTH